MINHSTWNEEGLQMDDLIKRRYPGDQKRMYLLTTTENP